MSYAIERTENQADLETKSSETCRPKVVGALDAARHGRVFPLKPNTEEPLIPNWHVVAKGIDAEQEIRACWDACPDANIGFVLDDISVVEFHESDGPVSDKPALPSRWQKLEYAQALARAGLRIFPCREDDPDETDPEKIAAFKRPLAGFDGWQKRATTDADRIKAWWQQGDYNLGVATGPGGHIVVLDFDVKNGLPGLETLRRLETEYGLPPSFRVTSPSGGVHVYVRIPAGIRIKNSVNKIMPGLDIRANAAGGYVVGPGSTLGGKPYKAIGTPSDIADCPDAILKLLLDYQNGNATLETRSRGRDQKPGCELDQEQNIAAAKRHLVEEAPEAIQGSGGDNTTFAVACRVLDYGLSKTEAFDLLAEHWNEQKARPPWGLDDLKQKVANAWEYRQDPIGRPQDARADARDEFEPVDLPIEESGAGGRDSGFEGDPLDLWADESFPPDLPPGLLPPALDAWVTDEAGRKGVQRGPVALAGLVACAAAAPASFELQVKQHDRGHTDKAILWGALIGSPAARKSPVLKAAIRPLKAVDEEWHLADQEEWRAYEVAMRAWKECKPRDRGPEPQAPRRRRKIVNDTTIEALAPILRDNPSGILSFTDELAGWIGAMDAYRPGKATSKDQPFWLSAKQGDAYTVDRVGRDSLRVPHAAVHVLGGIQPDVIRKAAQDFSGNGLMQRFLLVNMPPASLAIDREENARASEDYLNAIRSLAHLQDNDFVPTFRFSPEADRYRQDVVAFRDRLLSDPDVPLALQGWLGKTESEWARLALILHLVEWAADFLAGPFPEEVISAETAARAARLILDWQYPHQRFFYQSVTGYAAAATAHALNVAGYILAHGLQTISRTQIDRNCCGLKGAGKHKARLAAMRILELGGWARVAEWRQKEPNKWEINPAVHDGRFKQRAEAEKLRRDAARQKIIDAGAARREGANDTGVARDAA